MLAITKNNLIDISSISNILRKLQNIFEFINFDESMPLMNDRTNSFKHLLPFILAAYYVQKNKIIFDMNSEYIYMYMIFKTKYVRNKY